MIAARMSSTRLPGKVLRPILGVPMLERMIERLRRCRQLDEIVIATSTSPGDDAVVDFARERSFLVERGPENDVLGRYFEVASRRGGEVVVRLTGDCPLIDPEVTDRVIAAHLAEPGAELSSNVFVRTYPRGFDTEVLSFSLLERLHRELKDPLYREHVTNFVYDYPEKFKIVSVTAPADGSDLRLCVDTEEDFKLAVSVYDALYPANPVFGAAEIAALFKARPELRGINSAVTQSKIFMRRTRA
ncbi:MAG: glycosyltransferase family protein [Candidatus Omnitrophica bacterium]|nr:glycosyltransferase family protein [Candidatus Omnitrophota bacterium]